jgi:hypothetical protein
MVLQAITKWFRPKQQTQQVIVAGQFPKVQKPPLQQTSSMFVQKKQQTRQGQTQQQQTRQGQTQQTQTQQVLAFVPKQNLPPMKETSQELATTSQLADAITQQVSQQARQSGQQLAQRQKVLTPSQLRQARNAHAQVLSYSSQARSLLNDIRKLMSARQSQTQQSKRQAQKAKKDAKEIVAELRVLLEQIAAIRQQSQQVQKRHIRQLQQIKTTLIAQAQGVVADKSSKKVIQHNITPEGNKLRISVDIKPETDYRVIPSF